MQHYVEIPCDYLKQLNASDKSEYYLKSFSYNDREVRALMLFEATNASNSFFGVDPDFNQKSLLEKYDSVLREIAAHQYQWGRNFVFGIFEKKSTYDRLVGEIGVKTTSFIYTAEDEKKNPIGGRIQGKELSICLTQKQGLGEKLRAKGVALAATETLLDQVAVEDRGDVIFARVRSDNEASLRFCAKCGLTNPLALKTLGGKACEPMWLLRADVQSCLKYLKQQRTEICLRGNMRQRAALYDR